MSPSSGPPVSPRLLDQLARTLRAIEGARRDASSQGEAVAAALADLDVLSGYVEESAQASLPEGIPSRLDDARGSLEEREIEKARETLVEVGRSIDDYLKG